jgi:hypothetical protein
MHSLMRNPAMIRVVGVFSLAAGVVELFLVLTRAHFVFSSPQTGLVAGLSVSPLAFVAQIGLLVVLTLIGIAFAGRGIQLCLGSARRSAES